MKATELVWDRRSQSSNNALNLVYNLREELRTAGTDILHNPTAFRELYHLEDDFHTLVLDASNSNIVASTRKSDLVGSPFSNRATTLIPGNYNGASVFTQYASLTSNGGGWASYETDQGTRYDFVLDFADNTTTFYLISGFYASTFMITSMIMGCLTNLTFRR